MQMIYYHHSLCYFLRRKWKAPFETHLAAGYSAFHTESNTRKGENE